MLRTINNRISFAFVGTMLAAGLGFTAFSGCDQAPASSTADTTIPASHAETTPSAVAADQRQSAPVVPNATPAKPAATPVRTNSGNPAPTPGAKLVFDTLIYDFGTAYTSDPLHGEYNFTNEGTSDLLITRVKPGCGCTSSNAAALANTTYKPGETGKIEFTFNPKGHGQQNKTITVVSSDEEQTTMYLQLRANILPSVKLMNQTAQFGTIQAGQAGKAVVKFQSRDPEFYVKSVTLPDDTQLTWTFKRFKSSAEADYPGAGQVTFVSNADAATGPISEQAIIEVYAKVPEAPDKTSSEFRAVVGGNILAKFQFEPRFLRFPTSSPGDSVETRTIISHLEGEPFKILKVEFDKKGKPGDDFTITHEEVAGSEGKMYQIVLKGTCPPLGRSFRGAVYVYTDAKNHGPVTLRYNGIIRPLRRQPNAPSR